MCIRDRPNVASPIIVAVSLGLAAAILTESGLSYLGLGVQLSLIHISEPTRPY